MSNKLVRDRNGGNDIIIDDGSKVFNIKNKHGKVLSRFIFRPADTNITQRYDEVRQFFEKFKAPDEMSPEEIEQLFIEKLDYLVNADTKETFFGIKMCIRDRHGSESRAA